MVLPLVDMTLSTAIAPSVSVIVIFPPAVASMLNEPTSDRLTLASVMVWEDPVPAVRTTFRP